LAAAYIWLRERFGKDARMTFEHFALIWPIVGSVLVVSAVVFVTWLQDRHERRRPR